jgi:hypothetical protein
MRDAKRTLEVDKFAKSAVKAILSGDKSDPLFSGEVEAGK